MEARLDPHGIQNAADTKEALEEFIESELDDIETELQTHMEKWQSLDVPGARPLSIIQFLNLLTTEEFHPQQGYRYLAVQVLIFRCEWDKSARLTGGAIRNYANLRGY